MKLGPGRDRNTGHTVWTDGRVHHTGFTTVFGPNTFVSYDYDGKTYDIDFNSQQEGRDLARTTYAAVTSRSYHEQGVNISRMDGSVDFFGDAIDINVWRALVLPAVKRWFLLRRIRFGQDARIPNPSTID